MARDYLAMYLNVQFNFGEFNVVAIRHFSANTARLAEAIRNGNLFTDLTALKHEATMVEQQKEITVLLDSTLPGRKKILPAAAQENLSNINNIYSKFYEARTNPVNPPRIDFNIRSGIRNINLPRPYIDGFASYSTFKSGYFDMSINGDADIKIHPPTPIDGHVYFAVTFSKWDRMLLVNM